MLVSSPKPLGILLTFLAFILLLLLTHRHVAGNSLMQTETTGYTYEPTDQTVLNGGDGMTDHQATLAYDDKHPNDPSSNPEEANWTATTAAKTLLQKVRDFRIRTQPRYNAASKKSMRQRLEDAELELEILEKESFDTKEIVRGVQELRVALKAAEGVMVRGP